MIKGSSLTATVPNIEEMVVNGEVVTGSGDFITAYVKREDLTSEQKDVYDAGVSIVSGKYYTEITNTTSTLDINRVTSTDSVEGTDVFDFETMSEVDKDKLRDLLALFITLNNQDAE